MKKKWSIRKMAESSSQKQRAVGTMSQEVIMARPPKRRAKAGLAPEDFLPSVS